MLNEQQLAARRAIEALRAGVPNRDAVRALGTATPAIEERFSDLLSAAQEQGLEPHSPAGLVVAGNFGSGKSHLLAYLQDLALARGFVASKIVISKETPLYDPIKLYRAAINAAIAPGRRGPALAQLASELQPRSERYMDFYTWVQGTRDLNQRFAATVYLYEHGQQDPELQERILQFWSGDPLTIGELRRALKAQGEGISYLFDKVDQRALALQRFRFAARLIMAAGYAGWVLLVDEVELIGRYSLQQRARSYAELARWTGNLKGEAYPGISTVFAITSDYEAAILDARHDRENVPARMRASGRDVDELIAGQAERGMRLIGKALRLPPPSRPLIKRTYEHLRTLHGTAYAWDPPAVGSAPYATSTSMREYVRWWITEWDLKRLDPSYEPAMEVTHLTPDLSEDSELEQPVEAPAEVALSEVEYSCWEARVPIPYRDQEELEDLGTAAFLRLEPQATPAGYRGALFQINARGEPIEFTYNRVETPSTFLWRPADIQRAAARRLTASLLELAPRAPRLIFCLATEVPGDLFSRDLAVSMPICRIATSLQGNQEEEVAELIEGEEPLHLFWYPAPPEEGSPERLLAQTLALYGLLLEPFERASTALDELYGVKDPANA